MNDILRVLFIPTSNSGVSYWRMMNFATAAYRTGAAKIQVLWWQKDLKETHPWEVLIKQPEHKFRLFKELYEYARTSDIIVFQMCHIRASLDTLYTLKDIFEYAKLNIPILTEIDDNIIDTPAYNPASDVYRQGVYHRDIAIEQFKASDGLIVSTPYLKEVYSDFNEHIYIVPNCIDLKRWSSLKRGKTKGIVIGWAGGATHEEDLRLIEPVVHHILEKNLDVSFSFCHGIPPFLRNIPRVECIYKWAEILKYPKHLAALGWDIAIAPLVDNAFNRGKSNLRWLEASALFLPCVASRIGEFERTIEHGIDGMLASNEVEFEGCLQKLIDDRGFRRRMGHSARSRIEQDFNVDKIIHEYVLQLHEACSMGVLKSPPETSAMLPDWSNDEVKPLELLPDSPAMQAAPL